MFPNRKVPAVVGGIIFSFLAAYNAVGTLQSQHVSCTSRVCYEDTWGLPPEYVESLFTDWSDGVRFDLNGDGAAELTSWTTQFSDDAFLVLDRNGNGTIDDYSELFGNWTAQAPSISPNGFLALSLFDGKTWGGNEDGVISRSDLAYFVLQLWLDQNHKVLLHLPWTDSGYGSWDCWPGVARLGRWSSWAAAA
jgi:hypothetical protein